MKRKELIIAESLAELKKELGKHRDERYRQRIKSLICHLSGEFKTYQLIADHLNVTDRVIRKWYAIYRESGLRGLLTIEVGGSQSKKITPEIYEKLKVRLSNPLEPFLSYVDAVQWVKKEFDVDVRYKSLRTFMIRHFKCKLKRPRKQHCKQNPQKVEEFKKNS